MSRTVVAFHAHPDDEALLTSGLMARLAAEGHRVVTVVATDGDLGLASEEFTRDGRLGERRLAELQASADALGVARAEWLGYADSGLGPVLYDDPPGMTRFVRADVEEAAQRLAEILLEERADLLLSYEEHGGYGHPDHRKVHVVGARAAEIAGTPRVLEATMPQEIFRWPLTIAKRFYRFPAEFDIESKLNAYTPRREITHRIDVRAFADAKRASLRAHASQATTDKGSFRTVGAILGLPTWVFNRVWGTEWYVDRSLPPGGPVRTTLD